MSQCLRPPASDIDNDVALDVIFPLQTVSTRLEFRMCAIIIHFHKQTFDIDVECMNVFFTVDPSLNQVMCMRLYLITQHFPSLVKFFCPTQLYRSGAENGSCSISYSSTATLFPIQIFSLLFIETWTPISSQFYEFLLHTTHQQPFECPEYINISHHAVSV